MNKYLRVIIIIALLSTLLTSCLSFTPKTDEQLIRERIDAFITAYNTGDIEDCLACLDAKSRNAIKSASSLIGGIGFGVGSFSFGINPLDLFGLAVANASEGDLFNLQITDIEIENDNQATVSAEISYNGKYGSMEDPHCTVIMTKEHGDWFIKDITEE